MLKVNALQKDLSRQTTPLFPVPSSPACLPDSETAFAVSVGLAALPS
jgi:hypothetical protein